MENRFCGENTRLISDIIDYTNLYKCSCIILLADFKKAFDSIPWNFLSSCLKSYGFGPNFQKWISTIYNHTESCVNNNGYYSKFLKLLQGIRQWCPLSALLFLLLAEVIASVICNSKQVKGISLNSINFNLCQLAHDDLFLNSITTVKYALQLFKEFYSYAGLKLKPS